MSPTCIFEKSEWFEATCIQQSDNNMRRKPNWKWQVIHFTWQFTQYYIIARARLKSWHQVGLQNPLSLSYDDHSISASLCTCNWIIFISFFSCVNLPFSSVQLELLLLSLCHYCPQQKLGPKTNNHKYNCCQKLNSTGMLICHNF